MKALFAAGLAVLSTLVLATPPNAKSLIQDAETKAAQGKKNVIVIFHASWCGWCHKLDGLLESKQFQPLFEKNYEIVHVDVAEQADKKSLETPGGQELSDQYHATNQGLPFFVILDPHGKKLADSADPSSGQPKNIGFPSEPGEVTYFMKIMKATSNHLSAGESSKLEAFLRKKP